MTKDYAKLYDLEGYLFDIVSKRFSVGDDVTPFDFFCIVIWKANRAKSKIASRLLAKNKHGDLREAVSELVQAIRLAETAENRLRVLIVEWKLRLPMASAILTVFYPDDFTVYDVRVCQQLGRPCDLQDKTRFETIWDGYGQYLAAVKATAPQSLILRDKDRWFWGKSFAEGLEHDIDSNFQKIY